MHVQIHTFMPKPNNKDHQKEAMQFPFTEMINDESFKDPSVSGVGEIYYKVASAAAL